MVSLLKWSLWEELSPHNRTSRAWFLCLHNTLHHKTGLESCSQTAQTLNREKFQTWNGRKEEPTPRNPPCLSFIKSLSFLSQTCNRSWTSIILWVPLSSGYSRILWFCVEDEKNWWLMLNSGDLCHQISLTEYGNAMLHYCTLWLREPKNRMSWEQRRWQTWKTSLKEEKTKM